MFRFPGPLGKNILGNAVDLVGTKLGMADRGISEFIAGGDTANSQNYRNANPSYTPTGTRELVSPSFNTEQNSGGGAATAVAGGGGYTSAPAYTSGGGSTYNAAAARQAAEEAAKRAANQASRDNTQRAIDSLGTELNVGYGNIAGEANAIRSRYDRETSRNKADYNEQNTTNNQSLLRNKQNALLAAAQGARGLRGVLSSFGAIGGDGLKLANRAVTTAANQDLGEATDTAATNSQALDKALSRYTEEDQDRREQLATQERNQRTALEGRVEQKRQSYYQKMADLFGDIGDGGNAARFLNMAGGLNEPIAAKTAVAAAPLTARGAAFTPGSLEQYLAGAGDMTVTAEAGDASAPGLSPNSLLAGGRERDERRRTSTMIG